MKLLFSVQYDFRIETASHTTCTLAGYVEGSLITFLSLSDFRKATLMDVCTTSGFRGDE
jgi:hypothetical protein